MEPTMTQRDSAPPQAETAPERSAAFFASELERVPLVVILRGLPPAEAVATARHAWAAGVRLVEVTLETPAGLPALEAVVQAAPDGYPVGAGTVTTPRELEQGIEAGARFAIAPGLDTDTVAAAGERHMPFLPGIATPTEAGHALRLGVSTVKVFPAASLGTGWISALSGPFPSLRMVATGGVTAQAAPEFLRAGAIGVGVGRSVAAEGGLDELVRAVSSAGPADASA